MITSYSVTVADLSRNSLSPWRGRIRQHLGYSLTCQLGVGHLRRPTWAGPGEAQRGNDVVGQFHVECGQERSRSAITMTPRSDV